MRGAIVSLVIAVSVPLMSACPPVEEKEPEWQQPPKSWDPQGAELTFNKKGLDAFNSMPPANREAYIEELKGTPGTFKGQAVFKQGLGLGEKMDDAQYGTYEIYALVPDPVLFEITIDYRLYCTPELGKGLPPNGYIEFQGTLAEMDFQADSKPRKMQIKVKADSIKVLKD